MSRAVTTRRKTINTVLAWSIGILIFFPILWTILTSFKTEAQAINDPPLFCSSTGRSKTTLWCRNVRTTCASCGIRSSLRAARRSSG
jgi:ABC-type glycerol-3-phosphate transport system permease component